MTVYEKFLEDNGLKEEMYHGNTSLLFKKDGLTPRLEMWNLSVAGEFVEHTLGNVKIMTHIFHAQDFFCGV